MQTNADADAAAARAQLHEALDKAWAEFKAGDHAGGRATLAYAEQLAVEPKLAAAPLGPGQGGEVAVNVAVARRLGNRGWSNPEHLAVAEALDKTRAEFKAGDHARCRATLAYAEQLHVACARPAEPTGEHPSMEGSPPDEAGLEAEPAAATGYGGLGGCGLCGVPAGTLDNSTKAKKKKEFGSKRK